MGNGRHQPFLDCLRRLRDVGVDRDSNGGAVRTGWAGLVDGVVARGTCRGVAWE